MYFWIFLNFNSKANMILDNMDLSADPCDNFYEFTCGGFVNKTRLAENQAAYGTFSALSNELTHILIGIFV